MSVINTNITSLIAQSNLGKSQQSLATAMERLSSGMRINSAKDDAAGQAIANRMTAQITGLNQAQRNANDGISVAQTAEGALNQVNDNLQRIRELSVQAANETNSSADLGSIQDEITQRLNEIDRISRETDFNGVKVLENTTQFKVQVGANDGEVINIGLEEITSGTLNVDKLDVRSMVFSSDLTAAAPLNLTDVTSVQAADWEDITFELDNLDFHQYVGNSDLAGTDADAYANKLVLMTGGNYYEAAFDADTNTISLGTAITGSAALTLAASVATFAAGVDFLDGDDNLVTYTEASNAAISADVVDITTLYQANTAGGTSEYYAEDADGNFYAATVNYTTGVVSVDFSDSITAGHSLQSLGGVSTDTAGVAVTGQELLTQIGVGVDMSATGGGITAGATVDSQLAGTNTLQQNEDGDYFVRNVDADGNTTYYNASIVETGGVALVDLGTQVANLDSLALEGTNTLLQNTNVNGDASEYIIENVNGGVTTYYAATYDPDSGEVTQGDEIVVDPLATLDSALAQVDSLRSDLGAIQNRFQDAITNLDTNQTNLSSARSRIEDADYALEVANMTRAQILQQAGTSVLAQANQLPQNVLSLLG
ncbi:flagellin [Halochromatium roseum]|uniref:flagellin N-terminal helical domain-containing protein n=1 Tax=Halochromatium roseum TaxID=391920 RepID=UPI001F5C3545|nr:flagellin [Halochromatium roseum]MBK5941202.1 hypothetical protein [Halochromatium roseum]